MLKRIFSVEFKITGRSALANIILIANAFVWYFYLVNILEIIIGKMAPDSFAVLLTWSIHFAGVIFSSIVGAVLTNKTGGRTTFLVLWMMLGVLSSLALMAEGTADALGVVALSLLCGISFGWGMPNCMGYYTDSTPIENRGRLGGMIIFASGLGMLVLGIIAVESIVLRALILVVWRISGLAIFLLIKPREEVEEKKTISYGSIFAQRSFISYLIPWIVFSLVNYLSSPVLFNIFDASVIEFSISIENGIIGIFAIVGGFLLDYVGRKRMAITGFVILGLAYAVLGIYPESLFSLYLYTVIDGIAWGVFEVIFVITIWGDLSYNLSSDKYYAIGASPFFISYFLELVIRQFITEAISPYAIFSFIAFFLFLAVFPLTYAPETLPEKKIRERELRQYIDKAKKIREKHT